MSIIYEALKKVEKTQIPANAQGSNTAKKVSKNKHFGILLYLLVIVFGFFITNLIFNIIGTQKIPLPTTKTPISATPRVTQSLAKPEEKSKPPQAAISIPLFDKITKEVQTKKETKFVLNGVFFSDNEGYALINNQIVRAGDDIDGAKIKSIMLEGVELESEGKLIKLLNTK